MHRAASSRWRLLPAEGGTTPQRIWALAGAIIALGTVAVAVAIWLLHAHRNGELRTTAVSASALAAEQTQTIFNAGRLHVHAVRRELLLRNGPDHWFRHPAELEAVLTEINRLNPERGVFHLVAVAPSGRILAIPQTVDTPMPDFSGRPPYFQALLDGAERALGEPVPAGADGARTIPYLEWVKDTTGRPVFILGTSINLPVIDRLYAGIADGLPAAAALFKPDGTLVAGRWPQGVAGVSGEDDGGWVVGRTPVPGWPLVAVAGTPTSVIWRDITLPTAMVLATVLLLSAGIVLVTQIWQQRQRSFAALQRVEEQQRLLLDELNHRVKNILATVQSIASRTLRGSASLEEFEQAFEGRLEALSRTSTLLAVNRWRRMALRPLVEAVLAPYLAPGGNIRLDGPEVMLPPKVALTLSMALHELATNAAKYGALSVPDGRVEVAWRVDATPEHRLRLAWTERDGPEVRAPERRGFGRTLVERGVSYELGGSARLEFPPSGVRCEIELPLKDEEG